MGEVYIENKNEAKMVKFPKTESPTTNAMLSNAKIFLQYHYVNFVLHGIKFGKGMENHHGTSLLQRSDDHMA
jgi:hypothetical protein